MKFPATSCFLMSFVAIGLMATPKYSLAQSGCCKERQSVNVPWLSSKLTFEECKTKNTHTDTEKSEDKLFQPMGLVWWDLACY